MTDLERVRTILRSEAPVVVVEAAAGCGKTHEAATLARDMLAVIKPGQQLLLLAHTNAATSEFRTRLRDSTGGAVVVSTFDSFALEILRVYAAALGLPAGFRAGTRGDVAFSELAPRLNDLLLRAPSIARHLVAHYPVLIVDEHQDASRSQHAIVERFVDAGASRVRIFGDPMQSIYDFGDPLIAWDDVRAMGDVPIELDEPWRWRHDREFGTWIMSARRSLRSAACVRVARVPHLEVVVIPGLDDAPHFMSSRVIPSLKGPLMRLLSSRRGSSVLILARHNQHVLGMRKLLGAAAPVYEGADVERAYKYLDDVQESDGDARAICAATICLLKGVSSGITAAIEAQLDGALAVDGVRLGRKARIASIGGGLAAIYEDPNVWGACEAVRRINGNPPEWMKVYLPEALRMIGRIKRSEGLGPAQVLDVVVQGRKRVGWMPRCAITTVHKAKGREADHVILVHCAATVFPDDDGGRRLFYVALTRARQSVTLLVPERGRTQLIADD